MQGSINFDGSLIGNITGGGGGGGDEIIITPVVTSGTKIADVSVNGVEKDLYCPTPPTPPEVDITPVVTSGTKIANVSLNGVEKDLYVPNPTTVNVTQVQQSGTKIATIGVNGQSTDIYAPEGGGHEYSTTEQRIGTWIDGRAVYEKTYIANNINIPEHGIYQLDNNITSNDIDIIMRECCSYKIQGYNNSYTNSIGGANVDLAVGNSFIYIENFSEFTITDLLITIRYVKISS